MISRRLLAGLLPGILAATCVAAWIGLGMTGEDDASVPTNSATAAVSGEMVIRGTYLARAGNCAGCHTARGGAAYAGGRAIETPFGAVYASNITPHAESGIGGWTADDFWRAMHHGKSRDGRLLYPAFPYPDFTRVSRPDSDALYAYLRTVAPVAQANTRHALRFPYNTALLLAAWRALYFRPGTYRAQADRSEQWNRGAYLVQGLGHCNACHGSRDQFGGAVSNSDLAGGMIAVQDWFAPALNGDPVAGLGGWEPQHLVDLLKTGVSARGAVSGPMAAVVAGSLQYLSDSDLRAMTGYLQSLPPSTGAAVNSVAPATGDTQAVLATGARLYERHCVDCHRADGTGFPPAYPPLAGNRSLMQSSAANPIRIVLNGGFPPATSGNPRPYGMPSFRPILGDDEVAAVLSHIRNAWGNRAQLVSPREVDRYRSAPLN